MQASVNRADPCATGTRLPLTEIPVPGESFASWLDRLGKCYPNATRQLHEALGLPLSLPITSTVVLEPWQITRISKATGVGRTIIEGTLLGSFGKMPPWRGAVPARTSATAWARVRFLSLTPRYVCLACFHENDGIVLLKWHHQLNFSCIRHRTYHAPVSPVRRNTYLLYAGPSRRMERVGASQSPESSPVTVSDSQVLDLQARLQGLTDPTDDHAASSLQEQTGQSPRQTALDLRAAIRAVCSFSSVVELPSTEPRLRARMQQLVSQSSAVRRRTLRRSDVTLDPELVAAVLQIAAPMVLARPQDRESARLAFVKGVRRREQLPFCFLFGATESDRPFVQSLMDLNRRLS